MATETSGAITPFLKWAGGKRWLIKNHSHFFDVSFDRYIEPFLGGGSSFFSLQPKNAILCDKNERLIETYQAIKDDFLAVVRYLKLHQKNHCENYYYEIRSKKFRSPITRAAQFIYLNRTCWNGLYRVNRKGEFNVPIGTKNNVIMDSDCFDLISSLLEQIELIAGDFELAISKAGEGDFVFVDPPYTVSHNNNGFVKYNENIFSWSDQIRLRDSVVLAKQRGAMVLVCNAHHASIVDLYRDVGECFLVDRLSVISGKSSFRGRYAEVCIKCF